ncbi:MAG: hypothetical protein ACR2NF_05235 [Pirellulales bacterium]
MITKLDELIADAECATSIETVCPHCHGTGKVPFNGVFAETLQAIEQSKKPYIVANRDHKDFECSPTALSNRLKWLYDRNLLNRQQFGREVRYSLTCR